MPAHEESSEFVVLSPERIYHLEEYLLKWQ